jgi:DNA-binding NarL/FixJ family response regulator
MVASARKSRIKPIITVAILEDNETLIKGVRLELDKPDIRICAVCEEVEGFLSQVKSCQPMIAIIDLRIVRDREAGFLAIEKAKEISPNTKYIIYTAYDEPEQFHKAINLGIKAFVTKNIYEISLDKVVHIVSDGGTYYGEMLSQYLDKVKENPLTSNYMKDEVHLQNGDLSDRELEILQLLDKNMTNGEIANQLSISINTIKAHTKNIREKFGVKTTPEAIRFARLRGII